MKAETFPLVSCIMPTYNRRRFVPYAIQYFLRQDYPSRELIILDDGTDFVKDLIPDHLAIRYIRLENKMSLGAKLNLGCEFAKGSIIAHWDDDDWYAAHRLSYQVTALREDRIFITGINRLLYYDLEKRIALQYIYPANQKPWLSGSSLCYKKHFWRQNNFADINVGMDGLFVWRTTPQHLHVLPDFTFAVHMIHKNNICPKNTNSPWWHAYAVEEVKKILKEDWHLYSQEKISPCALPPERNSIAPSLTPQQNKVTSKHAPLKNVFACLVHEKPECVVDLVKNLQYHDPSSIILLYNGGNNPNLLQDGTFTGLKDVHIYPHPIPVKHGYLHTFALRCMKYSLENFHFDLITTVDSDQLLIKEGYSEMISDIFTKNPAIGMVSSDPQRIGTPVDNKWVASTALKEYELWKPLLKSFPDGEKKFVYWTFWPSTVFSARAAKDLVHLFDENELLKHIMQKTKIWGTEEVILPTLTSLSGYEIAMNPSDQDYIKYQVSHSLSDIECAFRKDNAYWIHPVERALDNPVRKFIRQKRLEYRGPDRKEPVESKDEFSGPQAILEKIKSIEGWLSDKEADLLFATALKACIEFKDSGKIVEIGCYHGKSTVLFGSIFKSFFPHRKIYSIDPHDGKLGAEDTGLELFPPSFERFKENVKAANISDRVEMIKDKSYNVNWQEPVVLLYIDGLHDFQNVSKDFEHFEKWLAIGAFIVFHDYADYYPGVQKFVNKLLKTKTFVEVQQAETLIVLKKIKARNCFEPASSSLFLENGFPKMIHQSWKNDDIPYHIYKKHWVDSWKKNHADWEYLLWTDAKNEQLVRTHYPQLFEFYLSLTPPIKKADFCRFLYMHKYGGVYADLDFISLKNLSPLLEKYDLVLGRMSPDNDYYQIPNAFMASRPGNDFWLQIAIDAKNAPPWEQDVEKHAGPFRLQWAYEKYQPENSIVCDHHLLYPFDWIHFTNWNNGKYFKKDLKQLAERLRNNSVEEISKAFPDAYCLTFWTHNW